ncbi:MAG: hypothetical protein WD768_11855 [Phycisphaeraceae bacterium]
MKRMLSVAVFAVCVASFASVSQAVVVGTTTAGAATAATANPAIDAAGAAAGFVAVSLDLVNTGQPTLAGVTTTGFALGAGAVSAVNDAGALSVSNARDADGPWVLTFTLDTTINTSGYQIDRIESWAAGTDEERANQQYELFVSRVNDAGFESLGVFSTSPFIAQVANPPGSLTAAASLLAIADNAGGFIATNVDAVRFGFSSQLLQTGFTTAYREIDIFGTAATPEPASALLGLMGMAALSRRRRRA